MSEMTERLARVIIAHIQARAEKYGNYSRIINPLLISYEGDVDGEALAKELIEAMREPSEAMVDDGWPYMADPCWREDVAKGWRAMIDAALEEM